ncbi:hypothetical protein P7C70_g8136, partial [Phenoliferia sp. Uapishka_3]
MTSLLPSPLFLQPHADTLNHRLPALEMAANHNPLEDLALLNGLQSAGYLQKPQQLMAQQQQPAQAQASLTRSSASQRSQPGALAPRSEYPNSASSSEELERDAGRQSTQAAGHEVPGSVGLRPHGRYENAGVASDSDEEERAPRKPVTKSASPFQVGARRRPLKVPVVDPEHLEEYLMHRKGFDVFEHMDSDPAVYNEVPRTPASSASAVASGSNIQEHKRQG